MLPSQDNLQTGAQAWCEAWLLVCFNENFNQIFIFKVIQLAFFWHHAWSVLSQFWHFTLSLNPLDLLVYIRLSLCVCLCFFWSRNGGGRSGTFCACTMILEMIRHHSLVDVFFSAKTLRNSKPNMVETMVSHKEA